MRQVLVIEDDEEIRESLVETLHDNGHPAVGAANGKAGLELLARADLPCLILLDLMMPVMDGHEFRAAQLKNPQLASVPVVVLSAHRDLDNEARKLGASAWMQKPLKLDALLEAVKRYCVD